MAAFRAIADICGFSTSNNPSPQLPLADCLRGLSVDSSSISSPSPLSNTEEPPRKKPRRDPGLYETENEDILNDENSAVLVRLSLDLIAKGDESLNGVQPPFSGSEFSRLTLCNYVRTSMDVFQFSLAVAQRRTSTIRITASSTVLDEFDVHLDRIANLGQSEVATVQVKLHPLDESQNGFRLEAQIRYRLGVSCIDKYIPKSLRGRRHLDLLEAYLAGPQSKATTPWSLQDFYSNVHVPPVDEEISSIIQSDMLNCTLYPFQKRAVKWLLQREGAHFVDDHLITQRSQEDSLKSCPSFHQVWDADRRRVFVSHVRGTITRQLPDAELSGGILAEEMGLGKTVELITLLLLHQRPPCPTEIHDPFSGSLVTTSSATLIITPSSILGQWKSEIARHAPHLHVYHYTGIPPVDAPKRSQDESSVSELLKYNVVLTTYAVLSREIHYANAAPERNLRYEKKHPPRKSPLVEISWWRVCLDEAQMVESGVSQAATVARLIPRVNAWAVSGTPLRKDVQDLRGLLVFLRYRPYCDSKAMWDRIDKGTFKEIFGTIAMRHTKDKVRKDLSLPPQKRIVITVPFTPIEEQNYAELVKQMCEACGLTAEGEPTQDDWDPDDPNVVEKMREWLARLRRTCLHPEVGGRYRKGGRRAGPLRTVNEVLGVMMDQNATELRAEEREHALAVVLKGHIIANAKDDEHRSENALEVYREALSLCTVFANECRSELEAEIAKVQNGQANSNPAPVANSDAESDIDDRETEKLGRVAALRKTLRAALEVKHVCLFFIGTCYFQIKTNENLTKPESEEFHRLEKLEMEYYDLAKVTRKEILSETHNRAERRMRRIASNIKDRTYSNVLDIPELDDLGGIENRKMLDKIDELTRLLNQQAAQLNEWKKKVVDILLSRLVDEDEGIETTGDEYEDSTKTQDELYVYVTALRAIIADRHLGFTGQTNLLIDHEMSHEKSLAKQGKGHAPELMLKVMEARDKLKPIGEGFSMRSVVSELRSLITGLQWSADSGNSRAAAEMAIVERQLKDIQKIMTTHVKAIADLEKEQEQYRITMNRRLDYYRQLQQVSDTVAPYKEVLDETLDSVMLGRQEKTEKKAAEKVATLRTKRRFLMHLQAEQSNEEGPRLCVICQGTFDLGVLTVCGHSYCKDCIKLWYREHRTCPMCKRRLHRFDFHDISFKQQEAQVHEEEQHHDNSGEAAEHETSAGTQTSSIYTDISSSVMNEIKAIDLDGSYGSKIDMIVRHILWIRDHDIGSKSIIFSQFSDFLGVLSAAFKSFKIGFSNIHQADGIRRFREDASVECFLLDAKSDSSGLNLVNATHVFLCEPLLNPALEIQAIARVHRIGQHRATTVWMYLIDGTVEQAIYEISVARRLEHISTSRRQGAGTAAGRGGEQAESVASSSVGSSASTPGPFEETALDAANSAEMEKVPLSQLLVKKKGGGEIVDKADIWQCLFGGKQSQRGAATSAVADMLEASREIRAAAAEARQAEAE